MKAVLWLAVGVSVVALAGCGRANRPDLSTETMTTRGHAMSFATDASGVATGVYDQSSDPIDGEITTTLANGIPTSVNVAHNGAMGGGTGVPQGRDLKARQSGGYSFRDGDSFLTGVSVGKDYVAAQYRTKSGTNSVVSYMVGGNKTGSMPTSGSARYSGKAQATVFGSTTKRSDVKGKVSLNANYGSGGGSVSGKIHSLNGVLKGTDIQLRSIGLVGSNFSNGTMRFVKAGTNSTDGRSMDGSNYQGAFFGSGAREAAGTFQFRASGVPIPGGGRQNLQGVGAFGGKK